MAPATIAGVIAVSHLCGRRFLILLYRIARPRTFFGEDRLEKSFLAEKRHREDLALLLAALIAETQSEKVFGLSDLAHLRGAVTVRDLARRTDVESGCCEFACDALSCRIRFLPDLIRRDRGEFLEELDEVPLLLLEFGYGLHECPFPAEDVAGLYAL